MSALRVGTWNVQYARGVAKNRARLAFLDSWNADVWVLTETHDNLDLSASHTAIHSEQRYSMPGGRWTTIWTSLPLLEVLETADPGRCVAARVDAGDAGELVVYGTVLPWNGDTGPDATRPARGWDEFHRVVPGQGREWATLREHHPEATIVVAGDLNQDLGGRHYYGTRKCRALLNAELAKAQLTCLTTTDRFDPGTLQHPPIDHICAGSGRDSSFTNDVYGWNKDVNGIELSDHGGTLAHLEIPAAPGRSHGPNNRPPSTHVNPSPASHRD